MNNTPHVVIKASVLRNKFYIINMLLLASLATAVALYIVAMNKTADMQYRSSILKRELAQEQVEGQIIVSQAVSSVDELIRFAQSHDMVEVKSYDSFIENAGVALNR